MKLTMPHGSSKRRSAMGRPKKNTLQLVCRIDCNVIDKLKLINPSLLTRDVVTEELKWRHGALGKYIQRLLIEDIAKREDRHQDDLLERYKK